MSSFDMQIQIEELCDPDILDLFNKQTKELFDLNILNLPNNRIKELFD